MGELFLPNLFFMDSKIADFHKFLENIDPNIIFEFKEPIFLNVKHKMGFYFLENNIDLKANFLKDIIKTYADQNIHLIIIFEHQWLENKEIIQSRINAFFGKFNRIHGRKTRVVRIDKHIAQAFLMENHLQGYVSSKIKYGLYFQKELVAVVTFSAGRKMNNRPEGFRSFELIRFANKLNYRVIGGLTKLLDAFAINHNAGNIMTYVDAAWSTGENFEKLGFENKGYLAPNEIFKNKAVLPWNAGSIKFIKEFGD